MRKPKEQRLQGIAISRGIAIGHPFYYTFCEIEERARNILPAQVSIEIGRYQNAVSRTSHDLHQLLDRLILDNVNEGVDILETHLEILHDPSLNTRVKLKIESNLQNAEFVFQEVIHEYQQKFASLNPFFRERFNDIQDVSQRILSYLHEHLRISFSDFPAGSIVFVKDLTASHAAEAEQVNILGFVTELGGITSHAAIVAKAKGIPYVSNISFSDLNLSEIRTVILDGRTGEVILNPTQKTLRMFEELAFKMEEQMRALKLDCSLPVVTLDGHFVELSANIEMVSELDMVHEHGGAGVGLFRSEYMFLPNHSIPSEEEQFVIYRQLVEKMQGLPIVMRAFDIGGDKLMRGSSRHELNPFLGCRAIRFLLKERQIFKSQLRAILRASIYGEVSILFPMVSCLSELMEAKQILREAQEELRVLHRQFKSDIRIGCMVEVPSAAIIADLLACECDFLSIGTNDLVQYALAVDRDNLSLGQLYNPADPSVVRLIKMVIIGASKQNVPVSVCGEVAADPRFIPLLLGLGVRELSVTSRFLPIVKNTVRKTSIVEAEKLAAKALKLSTSKEIQAILDEAYQCAFPEDPLYSYVY